MSSDMLLYSDSAGPRIKTKNFVQLKQLQIPIKRLFDLNELVLDRLSLIHRSPNTDALGQQSARNCDPKHPTMFL